ncbi:hypothetical protein IEQ34_018131 [Dendrobium chrysotoxum]|uniref:Uncharacterized protein n=1 Tax=Dendrobium chrysotoxum TaxID=161865 RepID=A0AAV7GCG1_DENCH|nr:hypothetical protein IEQ34_018131 [Dendrobium chrysotoxum]
MASSKFLISLRHLISGCCCFSFFFFLSCFFFYFFERCRCQPSAVQTIDPIEARAVSTILARWGRTKSSLWTISGELCNVMAFGNRNIAITCDCNFHNGTVCHVCALNLAGEFPEELSNLTYLTNL